MFTPSGTIHYYDIKVTYERDGTANVIYLRSSFHKAAIFPEGQTITKDVAIQWAQKLESVWVHLSPELQECKPEQLAGLQVLVHIYQSNSESWNQRATQLCLKHRDTSAPFKCVLTEFRRHAGLLQVAGSSGDQQPRVLSAEEGKNLCAADGCSRLAEGKRRRCRNPCHSTCEQGTLLSSARLCSIFGCVQADWI